MKVHSTELRIKAKHLALEPAIIKKEELKFNKRDPKFAEYLRHHRRMVVGVEARGTHLARSFMEGKPYSSIENGRKPERECEFLAAKRRAVAMISKYWRVPGLLDGFGGHSAGTSYSVRKELEKRFVQDKILDMFDRWVAGEFSAADY